MLKINKPEETPAVFQTAWNSHDMTLFGSLFTEHATFVNRFGHYVQGVDAIVKLHLPIHETIYSDSTLENELIDIDYITDNVVVMHFWSRLAAGIAHPAGSHEIDTLILAVLTKQNETWFIRSIENVTFTNPHTGEVILRD